MSVNPVSGREEQIPQSSPAPEVGSREAMRVDMREGAHYPFTTLTGREAYSEIHCVRGISSNVAVAARTSWDGNPDQVWVIRNRNYAANAASVGAIRAGMIQCQNRAGGIIHWMRGLDIEVDNRGTVSDAEKGLRIGVRNNSVVTGDVVGLEIEMLGQANAGADDIAIDLIHNDDSAVTNPVGINVRGDAATDGFAFVIRVEANGLDKAGPTSALSALMQLIDDSENADLASAVATVNGVIKVVIGTTVCYIPTYASYTAV